jgi:hypothetical protein
MDSAEVVELRVRVPLLAGGGPDEVARRQALSVVSTVSGHLGRQSLAISDRPGTLGDRVRTAIDASPALDGLRQRPMMNPDNTSRVPELPCAARALALHP